MNKELNEAELLERIKKHPDVESVDERWDKVKVFMKNKTVHVITDDNIWEFADKLGVING